MKYRDSIFNVKKDVAAANIIKKYLEPMGWTYEPDAFGKDQGRLSYAGGPERDENAVFIALAPFVTDGSFIEMIKDDGSVFRWRFENGTCYREKASVVYDNGGIDADGKERLLINSGDLERVESILDQLGIDYDEI